MKKLKRNLMLGISTVAAGMTLTGCSLSDIPEVGEMIKAYTGNLSLNSENNTYHPELNENPDIYGPPEMFDETKKETPESEFSYTFDCETLQPQLLYGPAPINDSSEFLHDGGIQPVSESETANLKDTESEAEAHDFQQKSETTVPDKPDAPEEKISETTGTEKETENGL